ncbi:Do family serine endopeptidase [Desulforegula conservatrix]|uniref:Do family serine endopeptidase n=1 Tax=Desulforegula conservatrix TaxID=153026 RepID=UPI0004143AA7|nr:Do family serine endopeptidase [Desulforegula conservatrix]
MTSGSYLKKKKNAIFVLSVLFCLCFNVSTSHSAVGQADGQTEMIPSGFDKIAEAVGPAVVNIRAEKLKNVGPVFEHFFKGNPYGKGNPFDEFMGEAPNGNSKSYRERSLGTGFIIDKSGYIATNNHVVEDAEKIQVKLKSGEEYDAEIVGRDPSTDIALIKIKPSNDLPALEFGNSDSMKVGQWVVAIGSPFGLEQTVTAGIVSAKGRVIGQGAYDDFIQTDASINPGNSGGPLLSLDGKVIGINTAIIASAQGIGFAIPINMASTIIEQLKSSGSVVRGWLGITMKDIDKGLADYLKLQEAKGVLVDSVVKGDPADKAGIHANDVITDVNGKKIEGSRDLAKIIAALKVGDKALISVVRDGKKKDVEVLIAKRTDEKAGGKLPAAEGSLGIKVSQMTPDIAERLGYTGEGGVVVEGVAPDGKAALAGLRMGDVIKEINHKKLNSPSEFKNAVTEAGANLRMLVWRQGLGLLVIELSSK